MCCFNANILTGLYRPPPKSALFWQIASICNVNPVFCSVHAGGQLASHKLRVVFHKALHAGTALDVVLPRGRKEFGRIFFSVFARYYL